MAAESTFLYLRIWMPSFDDKQVFASVCMTIYHVAYDPFKCSLCIICSNVPPILSQHDFVSPVPHLPTASMNCWTKLLSWWMITSESEIPSSSQIECEKQPILKGTTWRKSSAREPSSRKRTIPGHRQPFSILVPFITFYSTMFLWNMFSWTQKCSSQPLSFRDKKL